MGKFNKKRIIKNHILGSGVLQDLWTIISDLELLRDL